MIEEIIDYMNKVSGKKYSSKSKSTVRLIQARVNECGYELNDFKKVIDIKWKEWGGNSMEKYFRPQTLFTGKFDGYLNQKEVESLEDVFGEPAPIPEYLADLWK